MAPKDDQKTQKFNIFGDSGSTDDSGDDDDNSVANDRDELGEDVECLDHVCAICDNGGELLWYMHPLVLVICSLQQLILSIFVL